MSASWRHFKVHVAIDLGTDGTALAYSMGASDQKVTAHKDWKSRKYEVGEKQKTIILLDENQEVIMYGIDAKDMYIQAENMSDKWLLFERFKKSLYDVIDGRNDDDNDEQEVQMCIKQELTAANGKKVKSSVVFIAAFKHSQKLAKQWIKRKRIKGIKDEDIQWIITVPAKWNDAAKLQMRQWTIDSGLVDKEIEEQCKIVYESDCASLAIQHYIHEQKSLISSFIDGANDDSKIENDFNTHYGDALNKGDGYILVDAGGGSVDIACHEILGEYGEFGVKEVLAPSGGPWGSCYIDDKFVELLKEIFSNEWIEEFKSEKPNIYIELIDNFQRVKATFYTNLEVEVYTVRLPFEFIGFMQDKLEDEQEVENGVDIDTMVAEANVFGESNLVSLTDEYLSITVATWKNLFDTVINPIINHIEKLLEEPKLNEECKYLCLVGGLSTSPYFQAKLKETFGSKSKYKLSFIIPQKPMISVVEGAAYFAMSTISRYCNNKAPIIAATSSISVNDDFKQGLDDGHNQSHPKVAKHDNASQYADDRYPHTPSQCNHLNQCDQCLSIQKYHSSFIQTINNILPSSKPKKKKRSESKKKSSDGASYEPFGLFRAKSMIKIPREVTTNIGFLENISDGYHYFDKTIALYQIMDVDQDQTDAHVATIKLDLHEKVSGHPLYCHIERENDEKKNKIYKFKIAQLFTPSSDSHHSSLPTSPRDKFGINHQMNQIKQYLKIPANIEQILRRCKWNKVQVFGKQKNTQRMVLYITHQDLNQKIIDYISYYTPTIIPIVMFGNQKHWIEYIVLIDSYSFGSIGVSLSYDKRGQLNIANLHLDWTAIRKQHEIAMPLHTKECKCFDGVNPVIDQIHVGNPDDVENKMKSYQKRYDMVSETVHKVQDHLHQHINRLQSTNRQ